MTMPESLAWTDDYDAQPVTYTLTANGLCICGTSGPAYVSDAGQAWCPPCAFDYVDTYMEIVAQPAGQKVVIIRDGWTEIRYPTCAMLVRPALRVVRVLNSDSRTTMADWRALCSDVEANGVHLSNYILDAGDGWDALPGVILTASPWN